MTIDFERLDVREVSRKTPLDGKLEISAASAERLGALGGALPLVTGGQEGVARLESLACTCAKASGGAHVHYFLRSELLRALAPGARVGIDLDASRGTVRVETL